jgi:hypothetical protein
VARKKWGVSRQETRKLRRRNRHGFNPENRKAWREWFPNHVGHMTRAERELNARLNAR